MNISRLFLPGGVLLVLALAGPATARADTYLVAPSGVDDTAAIQAAFDAAVADGPGAVVQFTEGTFYTSNVVAYGFQGAMQGMGRDATVIEAVADFPSSPDFAFFPPSEDNEYPMMFNFVGGEITIQDLTMAAPASPGAAHWLLGPFGEFDQLWGMVAFQGDITPTTITRAGFEGEADEVNGGIWGSNTINGVYYLGALEALGFPAPVGGDHSITQSYFRDIHSPITTYFVPVAELVRESRSAWDPVIFLRNRRV